MLDSHSKEREASMNLKEHLDFLIMMIPTLLLLVAAMVSLIETVAVR